MVDGSGFPGTGSVYLARGTGSYEGPLAYTSVTNNTTYWRIALSGTTLRYHARGEQVVLAQGGDRQVLGGAVVQTPRGSRDPVEFTLTYWHHLVNCRGWGDSESTYFGNDLRMREIAVEIERELWREVDRKKFRPGAGQ